MDVDDHEWELSKENVQPLRQGRHISSLVAALHQDQSEEHHIRTQQNNFELELRSYSGEDPFSVWDSYIKWTEQHYPKGGHDGQLLKLLERCLREFQADQRYTNDPRFINIWIKFACFTEDPSVVFTYMFDNSIGVSVASFYVEWALSLERNGDNKRADAIYTEGRNRQAEPKDLLTQRHQQFQSRVARNITLQIAETHNPGMDMGEDTEKRSVLERLRVSGTSHKVGVVRTGNVKLGSAGSLKDTRPAAPKQLPGRGITIFQDENMTPSLVPPQTSEWQSLPVRAVDNRENDKKPGVWTDAKVKQRSGTVPHTTAIPFQIHEDAESATLETPRKTALINTQPLSSRKAQQTDVLRNLRRPTAETVVKEVPMYQKDQIYNGVSEFSFEELRAIKYWKLRKEWEAEAERIRQEEERRLREEQMQQQMLEMAEKLAHLQAEVNRLTVGRLPGQEDRPHGNTGAQPALAAAAAPIQESHVLHTSDTGQGKSELTVIAEESTSILAGCQQTIPHDADSSSTTSGYLVTPTNILDAKAIVSSDFITPTASVGSLSCSLTTSAASLARGNPSELTTPATSVGSLSSSLTGSADSLAKYTSSDFITPTEVVSTNLVTPGTSSIARPGQSTAATATTATGTSQKSLRTPIFNSASSYTRNSSSSSSSSSFGRPHIQTFQLNMSSNPPSLESSATAAATALPSSNIPAVTDSSSVRGQSLMSASADDNIVSDIIMLVEGSNPSKECSINSSNTESCLNMSALSSHGQWRHASTRRSDRTGLVGRELLSAPSPTVYTREALQCVMGMFSTSFMSDEQTLSEEMPPLHGCTPSANQQTPFTIYDGASSAVTTERQCLKSTSVKKGLQFYCDSSEGQENMSQPMVVPKSDVKSGFTGSRGLNVYRDQAEDNTVRTSQKQLFIYHDQDEENTDRTSQKQLFIYHDQDEENTDRTSQKQLFIYREQDEENIDRTSQKQLFIYRDQDEDKENGSQPFLGSSAAKPGLASSQGLTTHRDQPAANPGRASNKGLFIYQDEPAGQENRSQPALGSSTAKPGLTPSQDLTTQRDHPAANPSRASNKGLCIYQDEPVDQENRGHVPVMRSAASQDLKFPAYADVDMIEVDREGQPIDFTIECEARNEMTIAPLDSFNLQAKYASTPYVRGYDKSRSETQESSDASAASASCVNTINVRHSPTPNKYLSPISEGSAEGCGEESKSCQQTLAATHVFPNSSTHSTHHRILHSVEDEPMEADAESDREVSMNEDVQADLDRTCGHYVDTTTYLSQSLHVKVQTGSEMEYKDPFSDALIGQILQKLKPPITEYPDYVSCSGQTPDFTQEQYVCLGEAYISLDKFLGEGGYAKVYKVSLDCLGAEDTMSMDSRIIPSKVIKMQTPACCWEFYVSTELSRRLSTLKTAMDVTPSIMKIEKGYFFDDGSALLMAHSPYGSLLNLVNKYKADRVLLSGVEPFACLLTIELLHMFEQIHSCGFIHADVKPDNFLLLGLPIIKEGSRKPLEVFGSHLRLVQLIDFGQSIDLTKFAKGTKFMAKVATSGFQCIEMRTDRPWTFQIDLFGLVGTIHVVLFGSYMNVFEERGVWRVTGNFVRKWNVPLWKRLFQELLNIPSCEEQPDLASLRAEFEAYFMDSLVPAYNLWAKDVLKLDIVCD